MDEDVMGEADVDEAIMKGLTHRIGVIWRLEALQMLRPGALVWALGLACLPAVLLLAIRAFAAIENPTEEALAFPGVADGLLFVLIPGVVCLLGLLLTATSAVQSELENRTWIYLAVRPQAKLATLLGKYLFAVTWVMAIAIVAIGAAWVALPGLVEPGTAARILVFSLASCLAYGALYLLVGVTFIRVGMVVAIAYTLLVELVLGSVPAVLNEITLSYHLRTLFLRSLPEGVLPEEAITTFGVDSGSTVGHVGIILVMTVAFLALAGGVLRLRQAAALEPE